MHTGTQHRTGRSWWSRGWVLGVLLGLLGGWQMSQAADFACPGGDVTCLKAAINTANGNGQANTITLAAGIYTLTEIYNETTPDIKGLPVITSSLTIQGAGVETTIIERDTNALETFRILKVTATGTLTLNGLTLRGGGASTTAVTAAVSSTLAP